MQNVCSHYVACQNRTEHEKMNKLRRLVIVCTSCLCLAAADSALADYTGLVHVTKADDDTVDLCNNANGPNILEPLDVCNILAQFTNPEDRLISVGNGDITASNGLYFQHMLNPAVIAPTCFFVGLFPDLICDTFITIGYKCGPDPAGTDRTFAGPTFNPNEFAFNGHVLGDWGHATPTNGQGDAGTWPDLQVLFLQSSVAQGLSMSGMIGKIIWEHPVTGDLIVEGNISIECGAAGEPAAIPTVSEWGLIIMTLLALTAGTIVFARRRRPTLA